MTLTRNVSGCHLGQPRQPCIIRTSPHSKHIRYKGVREGQVLTRAFALCPETELSSTVLVETRACSSASATGASVVRHQFIVTQSILIVSNCCVHNACCTTERARHPTSLLRKPKNKLSFDTIFEPCSATQWHVDDTRHLLSPLQASNIQVKLLDQDYMKPTLRQLQNRRS